MTSALRALRAFVVFTVLTGLAYPLVITAAAHVAFPRQADGSLVTRSDAVVGSTLIGQSWNGKQWFYGRPSAVEYDAAASGASNLGPTSKSLAKEIRDRANAIVAREAPYGGQTTTKEIPVDLLTASASGLDPDISVAAAMFQVPRIARVRGLSRSELVVMIQAHTSPKTLGVWGQQRVNVLELNLALAQTARR